MSDSSAQLDRLTHRTITEIHMAEETLTFVTDAGPISWCVDGDCCSVSCFYDFYGVANLLAGHQVTLFEEIDLVPGDPGYHEDPYDEIKVYGYRITTEHPLLGPLTAALSFRNSSNGFYGGMMLPTTNHDLSPDTLITTDQIGD